MRRKIFKSGNSLVISLPQEYLEALGVEVGTELVLDLDRENQQVIIKPVQQPLENVEVTPDFAKQLDAFIEEYRPALDKLAGS